MAFTPRLNAPSTSNKYYYSGNPFYQSGYGMPNCTCYAYGRFYEISGTKPKLSLSNAENWWGHNDGYKRGQTPKLGAVICWRKGQAGKSSDGAGHVASVEVIYDNGDILCGNSAWKGTNFYTKRITKASGYSLGSGYTFQGFIYNPKVTSTQATKTTASTISYKVGATYTLQANMKVRTGAGTNYRWKKRSELTANGQANAQSGTYAVLKKGTRVTCLAVSNGWIKIPSGWVCGKQGDTIYIK